MQIRFRTNARFERTSAVERVAPETKLFKMLELILHHVWTNPAIPTLYNNSDKRYKFQTQKKNDLTFRLHICRSSNY